MKIFRNIYLKLKFKIWINIKKGYKKYLKNQSLEEFRALKNDLYQTKSSSIKSNSYFIKKEIIELSYIQYVNQKLFGSYFFYAFLYFYNLNREIIFPIPREFNSILRKHYCKVNFLLSNFLWHMFVLLHFFIGVKNLLSLIFSSFKKSGSIQLKSEYCFYANINHEKFNLPDSSEENDQLYNVVNWCNKNFNKIYSIFIGKGIKVKNNYYTSYTSLEKLFSYNLKTLKVITWSIKIFLLSIFYIFSFRWWNLLLFPEVVKTGYIKYSRQKLPNYIIYVWTNNHYRPLWTYEFDNKTKIYMISVGTLNGIIPKGKSELTKNDFEGLSIASWPIYYAWSKEHKKYITDRIKYPSEVVNLNKHIYFKDTSTKLKIPSRSISVFGYENHKYNLGISTLADYNMANKDLLQRFYEEINTVLKENNYYLILKRKKKLGKIEIKRNNKFFEKFRENENVIFVDEDHAVEKIIDLSKASISMPFTSPAFIANKQQKPSIFYDPFKWINTKDPSAMNLEIINNQEDLNYWVKKND